MIKWIVFFILFIGLSTLNLKSYAQDEVETVQCTPKDAYMPVGGSCCDGLIPQKDGQYVKCVEKESWFSWDDFFMGLAIPFLVFAYIAIFVKRKQKNNS